MARYLSVASIVIGAAVLLLAVPQPAIAADSDLSTTVTGPMTMADRDLATITFTCSNAGPDTALSAYVNLWIPSGVPAPLPELTPEQIDALVNSVVTDGLGNQAFLFVDIGGCEHLLFQVQEQTGTGGPMLGLVPSATSENSFALERPGDTAEIAALVIDEPISLAAEYRAAVDSQWLTAADWGRYTRGTCDGTSLDCSDLTTCFGGRVSYSDPIDAEFELVDDGSALPTEGCNPLVGFTPGNIAVIERGTCEFGVKGVNAQDAGAAAVVLINDGRCIDFPDSPLCAINMAPGMVGDQVDIPLIMLSVADGQPILDALTTPVPVFGRLGPVGSQRLTLDAYAFVVDPGDLDPDESNNLSTFELELNGIFGDGFESGDTARWSQTAP
jgi:hypothetical protein